LRYFWLVKFPMSKLYWFLPSLSALISAFAVSKELSDCIGEISHLRVSDGSRFDDLQNDIRFSSEDEWDHCLRHSRFGPLGQSSFLCLVAKHSLWSGLIFGYQRSLRGFSDLACCSPCWIRTTINGLYACPSFSLCDVDV